MRALLVRLTAMTAFTAAFLSGFLTAMGGAHWLLVAFRAALAFLLVAAVGFGFGLILMRTALRRWYEESRTTLGSRRARGNR